MKKVRLSFYSFRPRIRVEAIWMTDQIPSEGDYIKIENKFISEWDKKFFPSWITVYGKTFQVEKRIWFAGFKSYREEYDLSIDLTWTKEESSKVEKYLEKYKNESK